MDLVYHFDSLVIDTQPAVETDLEDVCSVVAAGGTVSVVVHNCKEPVSPLAFKYLAFYSRRKQIFTNFQIHGVFNILHQLLAAASLLEHEAFEVQNEYRRQLLQSHPPADFHLLFGFCGVALD